MRKATFFYLLRRGLLGAGGFVRDGLVMAANHFTRSGLTHPAQGSAEFDGSSDYIDLDDALNFTTESITLSFWVNTTSTSSSMVLSRRKSGVAGYEFGIDANGKVSFYIDDGTDNAYDTPNSSAVNDGDWYYISFVVDRDDDKVYRYIDGSNSGTNTSISSIDSLQQNVQHTLIGARWNDGTPGDYYNGNLANVAIWNRALTSDEINAVMWKGYQSLTDNEKSGLQAWYSLDDVAAPSATLATMEALAVDKDATIENKAAVTAAINALS